MKLVIFDVDGTLVDSQAHIVSSMTAAFAAVNLPCPDRNAILSIVGLSLPYAVADLAPQADTDTCARMVAAYKDAFNAIRLDMGATGSRSTRGSRQRCEPWGRVRMCVWPSRPEIADAG